MGGVVGKEPDGNEIRFAGTDAHNIADDRVDEVVGVASGTPDHMEGASRETFQHALHSTKEWQARVQASCGELSRVVPWAAKISTPAF